MIGPNTTMTAKSRPISFICEKPLCYWRTGHRTIQEAQDTERDHRCPMARPAREGTPIVPMEPVDYTDEGHNPASEAGYHTDLQGNAKWGRDGKSTNEHIWDLLDECIDQIKKIQKQEPLQDPTAQAERDLDYKNLIGYAEGVSDCLAFWAPPPFQSRELVLREAQSRWKMRMGEIDWRPTPGYHAGWRPEPGESYHGPIPVNTALDRHNKTKSKGKQLSEDEITAIRGARASKMFPDEQLAALYKVPLERIREITP